ncbi:imidazolonepropionase-like amidohydrolase [Alkalibacillus filiformis]|uniref:Imidazolonepropionase-like amidohydrolase n=1 Tax=Alkalibacillus filiformis TaxID=200990 RepID=A0ABU0DTW1_9BACI|nr:amidohydrolase family protein [Alkalibacillus filiformis]MDQ0351867.1 imidazolonepropionase-like amidohydrolase [Alkalibacillus filiformis]
MTQHYVIRGAQVLDFDIDDFNYQDIEIKEGKIETIVEPGKSVSGAKNVDFQGHYIIPGLIDMHVHIKEGYAPYFVAAGVTTVRNTGGNVHELDTLIRARKDSPTPHVYSTDRIIDGTPGLWGDTSPWNLNVTKEEEVTREIERQAKAGAKFIKVYGRLPRHLIAHAVNEAKKFNLDVSCDLVHSNDVDALTAAKLGVKWFEHASGILQSIYPKWSMNAEQSRWDSIPFDQPDEEAIRYICEKLLNYDVILCPTMILFDQMKDYPNYWKPEHSLIRAIESHSSLLNQWQAISQHEAALQPLGIQSKMNQRIAKMYADLGGKIVAGTDTPAGIYTWPGLALHRELELFVENGFSPLQALRAATIEASESIGLSHIGAIQPNKQADLVILNANPLDNIKHTKDIHYVIKGEHMYSQQEIINEIPDEEEVLTNLKTFLSRFNEEVNGDWYETMIKEFD